MKRTRTVIVAALASSLLVLTACGGGSEATGATASPSSSETIVIGSANFSENVLLAEIYAQALEAQGVTVERKLDLGSREDLVPQLQDGSIDLTPEYSGALLTYFDDSTSAVSSADVYRELTEAVPEGLEVLDQSEAEDKDALVVTEETADKYNLFSISDLKDVAGQLTLGGPPEWKTRDDGVKGLKRVYGLDFGRFKTLDAGGTRTVASLKNGSIDAADIFTTDPNIATEGWVVLPDPNNLFAAQNVLPLIRSDKASDTVQNALYDVSNKLSTDKLTTMMVQVTMKEREPAEVAKEFLTTQGLV
ncbi:glycine/betaine ABC transporter substrate-binding protein [Kineosporia sp. J2-2]|uniref:Glycine/betaine ABC transporter substrate-binding protein n=1 Tax=Kineosporia corallincola TaxID=2835133 RepID=A0ABS5THI6_9ACTN|nr:ABC transporter substrate-binding protein [Kineosporia corallincola]MBT0769513.1 glycine/betaine ABC transporter substrate-binding protein [Kineosporia corallincola]